MSSIENAFNHLLGLQSRTATIERVGTSELVSGIVPATSADLTSDISEGLAYINGIRVVFPVTTMTYTALKDTYLDLSSTGILNYVEVANGAPAPAITTNDIRISKVVTDATSITTVTMLRTPKTSYGIAATTINISPANYFRNLESPPEQISIVGTEFVISKRNLDTVSFPRPKKGDRIKDVDMGTLTISEVREMFGLGAIIIGYRVRTS